MSAVSARVWRSDRLRGAARRSVSRSSVARNTRKNRGVTPSLASASPIRRLSASDVSPARGLKRSSVASEPPGGCSRGMVARRTARPPPLSPRAVARQPAHTRRRGPVPSAHARPRTEPGSGWHGLPRRVKPERPKEVAKIVDLLGAGEKFPQHHGTPGSETTKVGRCEAGLRTAMLRRGANQCGMANAECGMTRRPS